LTSPNPSGIKGLAAVAATRGDLGQLAPRKKLLKSFSSFPEDFLRPSEHFGTEGFSFLPLPAALIEIPRGFSATGRAFSVFGAKVNYGRTFPTSLS
jgi:hypothetical protein